jgi:hypothetical protein
MVRYLHLCPLSRRRRRKGNPVPGGITGPPCSGGIYIRGPGLPYWENLEFETENFTNPAIAGLENDFDGEGQQQL